MGFMGARSEECYGGPSGITYLQTRNEGIGEIGSYDVIGVQKIYCKDLSLHSLCTRR